MSLYENIILLCSKVKTFSQPWHAIMLARATQHIVMMLVNNLSSMQPCTVYTDTSLIYYLFYLIKNIQLKITSFAIIIHMKNTYDKIIKQMKKVISGFGREITWLFLIMLASAEKMDSNGSQENTLVDTESYLQSISYRL